MAGLDAHPFAWLDATGGPAFVAPAADPGVARFDATLAIEYASQPLGQSALIPPTLDGLATVTMAMYARPARGVRVDFVIPVHGSAGTGGSAIGAGDLRLGASIELVQTTWGALSVVPTCFAPTGSVKRSFGSGLPSCGGIIAGGLSYRSLDLTANVGARGTVPTAVGEFEVGPGPLAGIALTAGPERGSRLSVSLSAHGTTGFREVPVLAELTARVRVDDDYVMLSVGKGLTDAPGAPELHVGLAFVPRSGRVRDAALNSRVSFEADGDFTEDGVEALFGVYQMMRKHPEARLLVAGHAAPGEVALEVSRGHAAEAAAWLVRNGVEPDRLQLRGYGGVDPISGEVDDLANDRVEFALLLP